MHANIYSGTDVGTFVCIVVCMHGGLTYDICTYIHMYKCVCIFTHIKTQTRKKMFYIYLYVYMYMYTYIQTHVHTLKHAHVHIGRAAEWNLQVDENP